MGPAARAVGPRARRGRLVPPSEVAPRQAGARPPKAVALQPGARPPLPCRGVVPSRHAAVGRRPVDGAFARAGRAAGGELESVPDRDPVGPGRRQLPGRRGRLLGSRRAPRKGSAARGWAVQSQSRSHRRARARRRDAGAERAATRSAPTARGPGRGGHGPPQHRPGGPAHVHRAARCARRSRGGRGRPRRCDPQRLPRRGGRGREAAGSTPDRRPRPAAGSPLPGPRSCWKYARPPSSSCSGIPSTWWEGAASSTRCCAPPVRRTWRAASPSRIRASASSG
jgi:hypothetical protein